MSHEEPGTGPRSEQCGGRGRGTYPGGGWQGTGKQITTLKGLDAQEAMDASWREVSHVGGRFELRE